VPPLASLDPEEPGNNERRARLGEEGQRAGWAKRAWEEKAPGRPEAGPHPDFSATSPLHHAGRCPRRAIISTTSHERGRETDLTRDDPATSRGNLRGPPARRHATLETRAQRTRECLRNRARVSASLTWQTSDLLLRIWAGRLGIRNPGHHQLIVEQLLPLLLLLGPRVDQRAHDAREEAHHLQCDDVLCEQQNPGHHDGDGV